MCSTLTVMVHFISIGLIYQAIPVTLHYLPILWVFVIHKFYWQWFCNYFQFIHENTGYCRNRVIIDTLWNYVVSIIHTTDDYGDLMFKCVVRTIFRVHIYLECVYICLNFCSKRHQKKLKAFISLEYHSPMYFLKTNNAHRSSGIIKAFLFYLHSLWQKPKQITLHTVFLFSKSSIQGR